MTSGVGEDRLLGRDPSRLDPIAPDWLVRILAPKRAPVPWRDMTRVTLSLIVPLGLGVLLHQQALAIFVGMGALVGAFGDRGGTFTQRFSRTSAGVIAGLIGLVAGQLTAGTGVLAVVVVGMFAVVSALMSAVSATLSFAGLQLLVYIAIAGGIGGKASVLVVVPAFLVGAAWSMLMSFLQSGIDHAADEPREQVVVLLRSIAGLLRDPAGPDRDAGAAQREEVSLALHHAVDVVVTTRSHSPGRRSDLRELNAVLTATSRLMAAAFGYSRRGEPAPDLAAVVDQLATAVAERDRQWRPVYRNGSASPVSRADLRDDDVDSGVASDTDLTTDLSTDPSTDLTTDLSTDPSTDPSTDERTTEGSVRAAVARIAAAQADPIDAGLRPVEREAHRLRRYTALLFGRTAWLFAARLGLTMMVAEILRQVVPVQKPYWILLTAALVLKPDLGSVFARGLQRTLGTMVGVLLGALILQVVPVGGWLLIPLGLLAFGFPFAMSRNYGMLSTFITPLVFLLLDFATPVDQHLILARLADTALGAGVVLVVGYLCWPSTWRPRLGRRVAESVDVLADYVRLAFSPDRPVAGAARRRAYRALSDLRGALQSALAEPPPLSNQAAAWWPLIAQLEQATDRISHAVLVARYSDQAPAQVDIDQAAEAVDDLAAALRERRHPHNLPVPEHGLLELAGAAIGGARRVVSRGDL